MLTPNPLPAKTVLELKVNNHPGVMSHVCGLFSRRAYNVEGIACMPEDGGVTSRIWLLVEDSARLDQMVTQVTKLEDVHGVNRHSGDHQVFGQLREIMQP